MEFYFQARPMRPRDHPGDNDAGDWVPPKAKGKNVRCLPDPGDQDLVFQHRDGVTESALLSDATALEEYATFSLYHDQRNIWIVNHDAIEFDVGDGDDSAYHSGSDSDCSAPEADSELDTEDATEAPHRRDWTQLKFNPAATTRGHKMSFVTHDGESGRLLCQHMSNRGVEKVLGQRYDAEDGNWETGDTPHGGLVGELPLLLGLLVLATIPEELKNSLPVLTGRKPWTPPDVHRHLCHFDKRGVVITVWVHEQNVSLVKEHERGLHGPFFL